MMIFRLNKTEGSLTEIELNVEQLNKQIPDSLQLQIFQQDPCKYFAAIENIYLNSNCCRLENKKQLEQNRHTYVMQYLLGNAFVELLQPHLQYTSLMMLKSYQ
jgi:hypothetical protein